MKLWMWIALGAATWVALSVVAALLWARIAAAWKRGHREHDSPPRRRRAA